MMEIQNHTKSTNHRNHKLEKINAWKFELFQNNHLIDKIINFNIIPDVGLLEMQKRELGISHTSNAYHSIGTGNNPESESDTALQTEIARKSVGNRTLVGTQAQYRTEWSISDFAGNTADVIEGGLFTNSTGGVLMARVVNDVALTLSGTKTLTTTVYGELGRGV